MQMAMLSIRVAKQTNEFFFSSAIICNVLSQEAVTRDMSIIATHTLSGGRGIAKQKLFSFTRNHSSSVASFFAQVEIHRIAVA
jgi:hypothetical protein